VNVYGAAAAVLKPTNGWGRKLVAIEIARAGMKRFTNLRLSS
jgi:hypothetical protein